MTAFIKAFCVPRKVLSIFIFTGSSFNDHDKVINNVSLLRWKLTQPFKKQKFL